MLVYQGFFSVFPTCVGVIPYQMDGLAFFFGIPHMCGGDPQSKMAVNPSVSVFPTYVRVNGGVSKMIVMLCLNQNRLFMER